MKIGESIVCCWIYLLKENSKIGILNFIKRCIGVDRIANVKVLKSFLIDRIFQDFSSFSL